MPSRSIETEPVRDTVAKVNNELALGSDIEFQRKWWRFEKLAWIVLALIIVADVLGCFGRGPLANAEMQTPDKALQIKYERIERYGTPSVLTIHFGPAAVHNSRVEIWVSNSVVSELGNQRISPQPLTSTLSDNGILYTFPATPDANSVQFALQPGRPGVFHLAFRVPGLPPLLPNVYVFP